MQPADAQRPQDGGDDHPLGAHAPRQQGDSAGQHHAADDRGDDQRRVPCQDGPRKAHSGHAHEVHGGDAQPAGQGGHNATDPAGLGQGQLHGHIEGDDDDGQRDHGFPDVVAHWHADVVSLHGDEMGAPHAQSRHQRHGDQIDPPRATGDVAGAIEQGEGDQQAEYGNERGER
ncbi:hypothetical protein D3C87_1359420 [compost metagenome]